ncbi:MAG TPA: hypothetical protein VGM23_17930 [Armatimonadota bacterium]|jgi:hypothetical protein
MDIRRADPELIIPAEASERGGQLILGRHPTGKRQQEKRRQSAAEDEKGDESAAGVTPMYNQDGQVQENEPAAVEVHIIDFSA